MITPKHPIAAFDFDGTITRRDTFVDLLIHTFGVGRFTSSCIRLAPLLGMYKLGLISNGATKQRLFSLFFSGMDVRVFESLCEDYSLKGIDLITRTACLEKIEWHRGEGHELVIVSASVENWIKPWALKNSFSRVIATRAEIKEGRLTGRFATENCYGPRKVERFLAEYPEKDSYYLYFYGDSRGDNEMIQLSDIGTLVPK